MAASADGRGAGASGATAGVPGGERRLLPGCCRSVDVPGRIPMTLRPFDASTRLCQGRGPPGEGLDASMLRCFDALRHSGERGSRADSWAKDRGVPTLRIFHVLTLRRCDASMYLFVALAFRFLCSLLRAHIPFLFRSHMLLSWLSSVFVLLRCSRGPVSPFRLLRRGPSLRRVRCQQYWQVLQRLPCV